MIPSVRIEDMVELEVPIVSQKTSIGSSDGDAAR